MRQSLTALFSPNFNRFSDGQALADEAGPIRYAELGRSIAGAAGRLRAAGIKGSRVGLFLPNTSHFPITLHAVLEAGGSALLLNPANADAEIAEQISDAGVATVLTLTEIAERLPDSVMPVPVDDWTTAGHAFTTDPKAFPPAAAALDDEAAIIFTSGMSGRTRGAVLTHSSLGANARAVIEALDLSPSDQIIGALPWAHAFGLTVCLNAALGAGATVIPVPRFHPATILELLGPEGATVLAGVPAMFGAILAMAARRGVPHHRLRLAICGGAPLPHAIARQWEEAFGLPLRQGYGLTEASPVCLFNGPGRANRLGTLGFPLPGVSVTIRDGAGTILAEREVGEICVEGDNVFAGYLDQPGKPEVLRTGDLGIADQGFVRFQGTIKPMFTRSGFNVYPREISRALEEDPRIRSVSVLARPDPARENEIVIEVVAAGEISEDEIRELCQRRLASYKQPSEIRILSKPTHAIR